MFFQYYPDYKQENIYKYSEVRENSQLPSGVFIQKIPPIKIQNVIL